MNMNRRSFLRQSLTASALAAPAFSGERGSPTPYGATPSSPQLAWSDLEFYNFLHFTVNTFTDKEWGYGDEDPAIFSPEAFDADAIAETLAAAGSKGVILTCKHHDGFCLWPTKTTEHSIKRSPFRGGNGDVVREISDAARKHGLRFGVYLSPWDRNQATYGTPEYITLYREQMRELLTGYGQIFEIWHDGANGGDGFYGGAREKRIIDKLHYYDWANTWRLERGLQPDAVRFSDVGPDVRWVGNEKGIAGETCWATYTPRSPNGGPGSPGDIVEAESTTGTRDGQFWMPAECDVSIRPGWFWHAAETAHVKTPEQLWTLYLQSVGRGASFLLNVPPDRRGLIDDVDARSLTVFGARLRKTFERNLAAQADAKASNVRGNHTAYSPDKLLDDSRTSYWATDDAVLAADVTFAFVRPVQFDLVRVCEYIPLGQRINSVTVETWQDGRWTNFGVATSLGCCRILTSSSGVVETNRVRLRVKSAVSLALSEFGLYRSVV